MKIGQFQEEDAQCVIVVSAYVLKKQSHCLGKRFRNNVGLKNINKKSDRYFPILQNRKLREKTIETLAQYHYFFEVSAIHAMLVVSPFSALFWIFYPDSGLTDILDGFLARKLHLESTIGAKPDSLADFVFVECLTIFAVINMNIPRWLWLCALVIALPRFASYGIGFYKYHALPCVHGAAYMGK